MKTENGGDAEDTSKIKNARRRMPASERAKQFMPYAALRGLEEALEEKVRQYVERNEGN